MKTSIILLTHNQQQLTQLCIESIRRYTAEEYELIVVDNGSADSTVAYLRSQPDVTLIRNGSNLGFAKGCNQGAEAATGDTLMFLNNDTIVTDKWLTNLLRTLTSSDRIGIVGPVSNYVSGQQQISVPYAYPQLEGLHEFARSHSSRYVGHTFEVRRLVGFCMLMRRRLWDEIGGFDERFGLGNYEDDDLCLRVLNSGHTLHVVYDSFIHHFGHATISILQNVDLGYLLRTNQAKAAEKWGKDIHQLMYRPVNKLTLWISCEGEDSVPQVQMTLSCIQSRADETISIGHEVPECSQSCTDTSEALKKTSNEWILWLHAGESLTPDKLRGLDGLKLSLDDRTDLVLAKVTGASSGQTGRLIRKTGLFEIDKDTRQFIPVEGSRVLRSELVIERPT